MDTEVERVVRRWEQLPLERALAAYPAVRELVQDIADETADATGLGRQVVPDHGPGVVMDQLRVMFFDRREAGLAEEDLLGRVTALRRSLP
ncbi:hypothetical protein SGUI_1324 [Serinicoccus hydrothermalis]|uniref:Uncharacterized protein n=1 Tax=Serinicoccus hydrothermalis TaxID=1758689 RepID=A0A1B1NBB3_9MICO|nr:hypothetical protein [Serinicoccus hydrothermalis]ANS78720.1 hypothetical protein SGUI_1324 [Serinicoccus hydrothermalis]